MNWFDKLKNKTNELPHISWREITSGDLFERAIFRRYFMFIMLLVILSLLLVYNRFAYEAELRQIELLKKELVDAKNMSLSVSKELMQMSRQSYVIEKLQEQGSSLQQSREPAVIIE